MPTKKNNIIQRLLANQITLSIIGLVIIVLISVPLAKNVSQRYRTNQEIANLQQEINAQKNKNTQLKSTINYMQTDQFVEEQARLNLGYKKPGEQVVVIQKQNEASDNSVNGAMDNINNDNSNASNFTKWIKYFFKNNF